jgi:hypothetical protein
MANQSNESNIVTKEMIELRTMVDQELNKMKTLISNFENNRIGGITTATYDGGISQVMLYYRTKYQMPINLNLPLISVKGNDLFEIANNTYTNIYPFGGPMPDLVCTTNTDIFEAPYLKKYYFSNAYYNFDEVINQYRSDKSKETKSTRKMANAPDLEPLWLLDLPSIILGLYALQRNLSLGLDNKDKLQTYIAYITEITEDYIKSPRSKSGKFYHILWAYQLLNPSSPKIKVLYYDTINDLIKKISTSPNNFIKIQLESESDLNNYLHNFLVFGLINDYLTNVDNSLYFYKKATINVNQKERFINLKRQTIEGFSSNNNDNTEDNTEDNNKTEKKKKTDKKKDKKTDSKKENKSYFRFIFYSLIFGILLYGGMLVIFFGWPFIFSLIKPFFNNQN